uniref:IS481 family transposase ISVch1 n=1 Tax=uncultured Dehalococcoidia bacterium TaxID=498747 RepID=A0A871YDQ3_9CHLR|nr:IS481 family transposase ISVch1 [uncultured Dehalococcoidia bacterium]
MKTVKAVYGSRLAGLQEEVSKEAQNRVKWFDYYHSHEKNARLTCRHFGISPQTFYRWLKRYDPYRPKTLETRSHRPKRVRQPTYTTAQIEAVCKLREQYPRWGKNKIQVLLARQGIHISASTVGRILKHLKIHHRLPEALTNPISAKKRSRKRPYAIRKPSEYKATLPGDIVEVDTVDVRPLPGIAYKHFTACDVVSRWNVVEVYRQATASSAARFLDEMASRMPNPIKAIQVDGGSEFKSIFEAACQNRGIKLFVLPPRSPKLNGAVERANRTHTEEFYEVTDSDFELTGLRVKLLEWENICNTYRPHQALDYLTPWENLQRLQRKEVRCH